MDGRLRGQNSETLTQILASVTDAEQRQSLEKALEPYRDGEFKTAADLLTQHLQQFPADDAGLFYQGLSLMKMERFKRAVTPFDTLLGLPDTQYEADALWFKGLCYLRMKGKQADAKSIFQEIIATGDSPYVQQARAIVSDLD